ncbi:MAG TPA: hypothetical protein PK323_00965 [Bacteroidia bacterium]|nr:hypothetical protein [Bacteroidia bacterium]
MATTNHTFTTASFKEMNRLLKNDLIMKSIESLGNGNKITIDDKSYTNLSDFIFWLIDNLN